MLNLHTLGHPFPLAGHNSPANQLGGSFTNDFHYYLGMISVCSIGTATKAAIHNYGPQLGPG